MRSFSAASYAVCVDLRREDDLRQPVAVAEVDEDEAAEVAPGVDPAFERDGLADVLLAERAVGVRAGGVFGHGSRGK